MLWVPGSLDTEDTVLVQEGKVLGENQRPVSPELGLGLVARSSGLQRNRAASWDWEQGDGVKAF